MPWQCHLPGGGYKPVVRRWSWELSFLLPRQRSYAPIRQLIDLVFRWLIHPRTGEVFSNGLFQQAGGVEIVLKKRNCYIKRY